MASNATDKALNIDANGLVAIGCKHAGTLYMHKSSKWKDKWIARFVIIARGWIYIFQDKYAKKAEKTFALYDFISVDSHNHIVGEKFCFCLMFSDLQKKEPLIFACEIEEAKQTWMKYFDEVIKAINGSSADSDYESITGEGRNSSNGTLMITGNQAAIVEVDRSGYLRTKQVKSSHKDCCQEGRNWRRMSGRTKSTEKCGQLVEAADTRRPPLPDKLFSQTSSQDALLRNKTETTSLFNRPGEPLVRKFHSCMDIAVDSMSEASNFSTSSRKFKGRGISGRTEQMSAKEKCDQFVASADFEQAESEIYSKYETEHYSNQATRYSRRKDIRPPTLPNQTSSQCALLRNKTEPDLLYKRVGESSATKSLSYLDVDNMSGVSSFSTSSRKSKNIGMTTFICEFPSTAESVLKDQQVGNFLVCPGKESTWVLHVKGQHGISKISIHTNEQNQTLSLSRNTPVFRSLGDLIAFYQLNKVPLEDTDMVLKECGNKYNSPDVVTFV